MNLASAHPVENEFGEVETNDVIIRSYSLMGKLHGMGTGSVEIEAREAVIPDRRQTAYFVKFGVSTGGDYSHNAGALVEYDHVEKLVASIQKLESASITTERFQYSEIEYKVDGLKIIVFNDARGKLMFVVSADNVSVHFNSMSQLSEMRHCIVRAKKHLESMKLNF